MDDDSQKERIERILGGDTNHFRFLVERYQVLVSHIVFRMISNRAEREDLCQEVFTRAFQNLAKFRFQAKFSTWIAAIAYNVCVNHLKKKRIPLYEDDPFFIQHRAAEGPLPDVRVEQADLVERLEREIAGLPAVFRAVLTLYHLDGCRYEEIGSITGLPLGTVKSYLYRARKELKTKLAREVALS